MKKNNPYTIQNIRLWCKLNNKSFELLSEKFNGNSKKLQWKCLKEDCGEEFEANWVNVLQNKGCGYCAGMKVSLSNCLAIKRPDLVDEWHPFKNGDLTPYDVTCNSNRVKPWWKCKKCGHEWKAIISNRNGINKTGCPECNKSKGEKQLDYILTKYNIPHDSQYIFNDLKGVGGGLLKFDIPVFWDEEKTKLRMLIEYDGIFHYEKQYKNDGHETIIIHDKLKNKYCKKHNIKLLRIPYWEFNNIEEILLKELQLM